MANGANSLQRNLTVRIFAFFERASAVSDGARQSPVARSGTLLKPSCSPGQAPASCAILGNSQSCANFLEPIAVVEQPDRSRKNRRVDGRSQIHPLLRQQELAQRLLGFRKAVGDVLDGHSRQVEPSDFLLVSLRQSARRIRPGWRRFRLLPSYPAANRIRRNPASYHRCYFFVAVSLFGQSEYTGFRFDEINTQSLPFRRDR